MTLAADDQPLVRLSSLTKQYPGVTALDALTADVPHGVVGLIGSNGAGKSTLMKILLGLIGATEGSAEVLGLDAAVDGLKIRELIGYLPEHDCLPQDISATQFVIHMARMSGIPASAARERTAEILRHVGLFEERYRHIGGYSTGMKQRVKLAQALVHDPKLLFLDEPTNGLDPGGRDDMLGLIERTGTAFGVSVIMSSHLLGEIESVCDSLVVIDAGKLVREGPVTDFTRLVDVVSVEVDRDSDVLAARLTAQGLVAEVEGRTVAVRLADPEADGHAGGDRMLNRMIVSTVAELGLPLIRVGRRRHNLGDLFRDHHEQVTP
ncbi:MAG: ABC transporter ATP-binding protein [Actinomycetota bacterium]|nr:ABC transporter ATP-binding protein [Actinomycetota bacterium]